MKHFLLSIVLAVFCATSFANDSLKVPARYQGITEEGQECTLQLGQSMPADHSSVLARAQVGGEGIPFYIGGLSTKFRTFRMTKVQSNGRIVALASEGDPQLELIFDHDGSLASYILFFGGFTSPFRKIVCQDLQ